MVAKSTIFALNLRFVATMARLKRLVCFPNILALALQASAQIDYIGAVAVQILADFVYFLSIGAHKFLTLL